MVHSKALSKARVLIPNRYSQNTTTPAERPSRLHLPISSMNPLLNRGRGRRAPGTGRKDEKARRPGKQAGRSTRLFIQGPKPQASSSNRLTSKSGQCTQHYHTLNNAAALSSGKGAAHAGQTEHCTRRYERQHQTLARQKTTARALHNPYWVQGTNK